MARINIEDKLFTDFRWMQLIIKCGCRHKAIGILTGAWMLAQKNWLQYGFIPEKAWDKDFDVLIEVELATKRKDGSIYIKGSKRAFAWLEQRVEAGRKGGLVSRKQNAKQSVQESALRNGARFVLNKAVKSGKIQKPLNCQDCGAGGVIEGHHADYSKPLEVEWLCKKCHTQTHRDLRQAADKRSLNEEKRNNAVVNPPNLSLSPTLSLSSFSGSSSDSLEIPPVSAKKGQLFIATYCQEFKFKYGMNPKIMPKDSGIASRMAKGLSESEIPKLVQAYFKMPDAWLVKAKHPIGAFEMKLNEVVVFANSGKFTTQTEANQADAYANNAMLLNEVREGKL